MIMILQEETEGNRASRHMNFNAKNAKAAKVAKAKGYSLRDLCGLCDLGVKPCGGAALFSSVFSCKKFLRVAVALVVGSSALAQPIEVVLEPVHALVISAPVDG